MMSIDIQGVRIHPGVIDIFDTEIGKEYKSHVIVKNISSNAKKIRFYAPQSKKFKLKVKEHEKVVASGLDHSAIIEYLPNEDIAINDRLVVVVDGDVIDVPIHTLPKQPVLQIEREIDFGTMVVSNKVVTRDVYLMNHGSKPGTFKLMYSGSKPISINPAFGEVPPKTAQIIRFDYVSKLAGSFDEKVLVILEGQDAVETRVKGVVVERHLELWNVKGDFQLECIKFGPTYYGTDRTESAILFNNSPESVSFVAIMEENAVGQETGPSDNGASKQVILDAKECTNPLTSLVAMIPNQGTVAPYQRVPIFFRFSPRYKKPLQAFKTTESAPPRQDFALFMHLQMVGSKEIGRAKQQDDGSHLEIALIGSALPVMLEMKPSRRLDFGSSLVGCAVETLITVQNNSPTLAADFRFRRIAHFTATPDGGKVHPGQTQDVLIRFLPSQYGTFKITQYLDVIGQIADSRNPFISYLEIIHTLGLSLRGSCEPKTTLPQPKYNSSITPLIHNEVGLLAETRFDEAALLQPPRNALINRAGALLHKSPDARANPQLVLAAKIAFPNDRATSIRPSERGVEFRTLLTQVRRHNYVDPDYAFTLDEEAVIKNHRNGYANLLHQRQENRRILCRDKRLKPYENDRDIGHIPGIGLVPPRLDQKDIRSDTPPPDLPNTYFKMLSTKDLEDNDKKATKRQVLEGLNAIPLTDQEKADCRMILTPQQLHQIDLGPGQIDFGKVCLRSISTKKIYINNCLKQYIHVVINIDCRELRQSSPLSQVVPPNSKAYMPLIFESNNKGRFQRNISYTINGYYKSHVIALAEVIPVALELSTNQLDVVPCPGQPAEAGIRGTVTLYNRLNYPADFGWEPIFKPDRGTAFSIRPKSGVVEAFSDLDCEVVFHPSFDAPDDGDFVLKVDGGDEHPLHCRARFGHTQVQFMNRRVMFGHVPLHMTTTKSTVLVNTSQNHAFFHVLNTTPYPGMIVHPSDGIVPVGGQAELTVAFTPSTISKFDCSVHVAIRGGKEMELRMGGSVQPPQVDIIQTHFNFHGVFVGSKASLPFELINKTSTRTRVEFDLMRFKDFCLSFPGRDNPEDYTHQLKNPGIYCVTLKGDEVVQGQITFTPTEIATYDFYLPVSINNMKAPSPSATPVPPTPALSMKDSIARAAGGWVPPIPGVSTPNRHVTATALRQPLNISAKQLVFSISSEAAMQANAKPIFTTEKLTLKNNSSKELHWKLDVINSEELIKFGVFQFRNSNGELFANHDLVEGVLPAEENQDIAVVFAPTLPGMYQARIAVIINHMVESPYDYLDLKAELKWPRLLFQPNSLVLTPVALKTEIFAKFTILALDYVNRSELHVEYPTLQCEDGTPVQPLNVTFLESAIVEPAPVSSDGRSHPVQLQCLITFCCDRPLSFRQPLRFLDNEGNAADFYVCATADNCLLTSYSFINKHRDDFHIVCEEGKALEGRENIMDYSGMTHELVGEAQLVPFQQPSERPTSRPSTTATSSNIEISTSSYGESTFESGSSFSSGSRDGAVNLPRSKNTMKPGSFVGTQEFNQDSFRSAEDGSTIFDDSNDTQLHVELDGFYHVEVLTACQRWFSMYGWPGGQYPITVPFSLRSGLSRKTTIDDDQKKLKEKAGGSWDTSGSKTEVKTLYDMITHLCGRPAPGIPISASLPSNKNERVKQIYWQHATLLTFIRSQGGCLSSVQPEFLMEPADYKHWRMLNSMDNEENTFEKVHKSLQEAAWEDELFEGISHRAWCDVLLQILKTLVLYKVTPRSFRNLVQPEPHFPLPQVNLDPLASNVYTVNERILLAWLNHYYENYRKIVWANCQKGGVPASRWIINFNYDLLDGLVLAAVLGAHCPFLIDAYLKHMYSNPTTPEQCLHNALKVVNALRFAGVDFDLQAMDITDPHPVMLLLLVCHLYQTLPQYIPKNVIEFSGALHTLSTRQVQLSNPSAKTLHYRALLAGNDARDFTLPKGDLVSVPSKGRVHINVEFVSRFLRSADAVLVLIGRRAGPQAGSTTVFSLRSYVSRIDPTATENVSSPCYILTRVRLNVQNPFKEGGSFAIRLVEGDANDHMGNTRQILTNKKINYGEDEFTKINKKSNDKCSRTNLDQSNTRDIAMCERKKKIANSNQNNDSSGGMLSFFCHEKFLELAGEKSASLEVNFLPFQVGSKQCSIVFSNETIGEFLYSIEATAQLPLPTSVPFKPGGEEKGAKSARISLLEANSLGQGLKDGEATVFFRCQINESINETLKLPFANVFKEGALLKAAQQYLSDEEVNRRRVTGTLDSSTLINKAIEMLAVRKQDKPGGKEAAAGRKFQFNSEKINFKVTLDSEYFTAPSTLSIANRNNVNDASMKQSKDYFSLPLSFKPKSAGIYPCQITLTGPDDVRVYRVECMVIPEGSNAELQFHSPVQVSVTQMIPLINRTAFDWNMRVELTGIGFNGPDQFIVKALSTTNYPLIFRPTHEGEVNGLLRLTNLIDGTDHSFQLFGVGKRPLALDHLMFECKVGETISRTVVIPNATRQKLVFQVESDIDFVNGKEFLSVLPGRNVEYHLFLTPNKRGHFNGIVSFVAGKKRPADYDSDGDEIPPIEDDLPSDYRVWYSLDVLVSPADATNRVDLKCACHNAIATEFKIDNPLEEAIEVFAEIQGECLSGSDRFHIPANGSSVYQLVYKPEKVGDYRASVIFFNEFVGEFWYDVYLMAIPPPITIVEPLECELGKFSTVDLKLNNPSQCKLLLEPQISNSNNYGLQVSHEGPIEVAPEGTTLVRVRFTPSDLGYSQHGCRITFNSEHLGEWIFELQGSGLLPRANDPVCITAAAGHNKTLLIPFHNPLDVPVLCDVILTDNERPLTQLISSNVNKTSSPFCLLLKHDKNIRVGAKCRLDIPISFAPHEMRQYEALCVVVVRLRDGSGWHFSPEEPLNMTRSENGGIQDLRWLFPLKGIPEHAHEISSGQPIPQLCCKARNLSEERLEVWLTGVAPSPNTPHLPVQTRAKTPASLVKSEETFVSGQEPFEIQLNSQDSTQQELLNEAVRLEIVRQHRETLSGMLVLTLGAMLKPFKSFRIMAELVIKSGLGGIWRYPIEVVSTEPDPDDIITIHAVGLNQESWISFRLDSQTAYSEPFQAYFEEGGDADFKVIPQSGELPPSGEDGLLFSVCFQPSFYGKPKKSRLIIQTREMEWTYDFVGNIPEYLPPIGQSSQPIKGPHPDPRLRRHGHKRNFLRENIKLITTGVSSPLKGTSIIPVSK